MQRTRRTRWIVLAAALALATTAGPATMAVTAADAIEPGQGTAIAQIQKIDPRAGGLSLGITFGQSVAAHQNAVAQGSSQAVNMGVIGTTLASEGCDGGAPTWPADQQPQALRVDSRDKDAAAGRTATEYGIFTKKVRADATPIGEAETTSAPFVVPGVISIGGGVSRSHSGLVKGVREAKATTDLSYVDLAGAVRLSSLHWEATYRSSGDNKVLGGFSIGSATINGQAVPTADPSAVLAAANPVLAPLGIRIVPPTSRRVAGVLFVDPLSIAIVPSPERDAVAGAVIGGAQPVRQPLIDALLAMDCGNATYITIFDLIVGSITGAGELAVSLGGVQASSSAIPKNQFTLELGQYELGGDDGVLGAGSDLGPPPGFEDDRGGLGADLVAQPTTPDVLTPAAGGVPPRRSVIGAARGERGGRLALVGLATLGLLALLAEGDRRKMRHAQRQALDS